MNTRFNAHKSPASRLTTVACAVVLLAVAAAGIAALKHNAARATDLPAASPMTAVQRASAPVPPEWQAPTSDASVPSASVVFKARTTPAFDELAATF